MRWDDLEMLRVIDESERNEQMADLQNGLALLRSVADGRPVDPQRDYPTFARELLLAEAAGLVEFDSRALERYPALRDPLADANMWLQHIYDVRLTLAGRDRARGRVLQRPLPDPEEDDERPIAGMTLEEIARAIGDTYTGAQLPRYLLDSGIPSEFVEAEVTGSKWYYVLQIFERLHDGGSAARRALREFLGGWLEGRFHMAPDALVRKRVIALLGQQGWHLNDGRLVIGDRVTDATGALTTVGRDARTATLHADVRQVATRYLESGHLEVAIFESFKAVNNRVKQMSGLALDGSDLMAKAFADNSPAIVLADLSTESGRNVQSGFRFLFMGAVRGIRNPDAHELFRPLDDTEAFERLGLASLLMRRLDDVQQLSD